MKDATPEERPRLDSELRTPSPLEDPAREDGEFSRFAWLGEMTRET
jgi:hypothetical protein